VRPLRAAGLVALVAAVVAALLMPPSAGAARPLRTGIVDAGPFNVPSIIPATFDRVRATVADNSLTIGIGLFVILMGAVLLLLRRRTHGNDFRS